MNTQQRTTNKLIGVLLITGAVALFIPYMMLIDTFSYPDILRQDTAIILSAFHEGGSKLIWTWFAFALTGLPLLPAYILMGESLKEKSSLVKVATVFGVMGLIVQMIGLLRWTFVVPVLADTYVNTTDEVTRAAAIVAFKTIHQFAGVLLGEHVGQLFTIIWTVMISIALQQSKAIPRWVSYFAYAASGIYILAQAELFATVMPSFPMWEAAGFLGSSLWLLWMIILGVCYLRTDKKLADVDHPC
jgi:hypothetical protein